MENTVKENTSTHQAYAITSPSILQINNLSLSYDGNKEILKGITLSVEKGEFISIIGASGCGKSTLLNVVAGFIKPTGGNVAVHCYHCREEKNCRIQRLLSLHAVNFYNNIRVQ
ncbi:ATP-binding cassette domain-containing protein [Aneurinibacillus tyrosinisolvens]|uniref:ATP-binding cassette domain-containing protein n=1 Tax=Aneurinibacillus tyrosinisolvens TaxID=1443435 RepID=UPI00063F2BBC|nr:ATP-binding cassette domain-containing protein [Aneurinibacillus tyrosinisolvens]